MGKTTGCRVRGTSEIQNRIGTKFRHPSGKLFKGISNEWGYPDR